MNDAVDPMANHKCKKIAQAYNMGPDRELWLGKLLEPIPNHPTETHCLHVKTPYKAVVWGVMHADLEVYAIFAQIVQGFPLNPDWLTAMARKYIQTAEESENKHP